MKTFGLILGLGNRGALIRRAEALTEGNPTIRGLVAKLAEVRRQVVARIVALDRDIRRLVRRDPVFKRFMTVPGIRPTGPDEGCRSSGAATGDPATWEERAAGP
ncbi:hypothetical protein ACFQU2_28405 [Siccirubricoccus deserti]